MKVVKRIEMIAEGIEINVKIDAAQRVERGEC